MMPEPGGPGGPLASQKICRSVNPIQTREGRLSPPITTGPPQCFSPYGITVMWNESSDGGHYLDMDDFKTKILMDFNITEHKKLFFSLIHRPEITYFVPCLTFASNSSSIYHNCVFKSFQFVNSVLNVGGRFSADQLEIHLNITHR